MTAKKKRQYLHLVQRAKAAGYTDTQARQIANGAFALTKKMNKMNKRAGREGASKAFDIYLDGRKIDTVFYVPSMTETDVKRSLVDHDGYDPGIVVRAMNRKRRGREGGGGIRSYGPGKFYTLVDSYAYGVVTNGFADQDIYVGDSETYSVVLGGPDLLKFASEAAAQAGDALTTDEQAFLRNSAGVIFFERSDGIVEADWFTSKKALDKSVAKLEKAAEGEGLTDEAWDSH